MTTGSTFLDRLIDRLDRLDPSNLQSYLLKLVREKGFLETIFNTIQEGIIVIDKDLRIRYTNAAARQLLALPEETTHTIDRFLRDVEWRLLLQADPDEWHRISRQEIEVFYPEHRHLSFYLVPMRTDSEEDELPQATLILRDVTELHRDTQETIESQKVRAITMLAAGVAHELGNPLNGLNIHLQLLSRCINRSDNQALVDDAGELLDVARAEVNRLDSIVNNFLRAVRPAPLNMQRVHMKKILRETIEFMQRQLEDRNIAVEVSWPENLPAVNGDPGQLKQAFYNIIKNAIQAMPEGGTLSVVCGIRDDFLEVEFHDTGKGISRDELPHIMEPYFTTKSEGTGLGLLIVDRIIRGHGGELGIESGEDSGAIFTIRLPLYERQVRLLKAAEPAPVSDDDTVSNDSRQ